MKTTMKRDTFLQALARYNTNSIVIAPVLKEKAGRTSDTDVILYERLNDQSIVALDSKSSYSAKEAVLPLNQTLFYFVEDMISVPRSEQKDILVLLRSCDFHAYKRLDLVYLENGPQDPYYLQIRNRIKFCVIGCESDFEDCFCVSMGTNIAKEYDMGISVQQDDVHIDIQDESLASYFEGAAFEFEVPFVLENKLKVKLADHISLEKIIDHEMWDEYNVRCIGCGACNFVCPTCTCFTIQDIYYQDNVNAGERKRVAASCEVDGFTRIAGGHEFRQKHGERMRFKVMHKVSDFKERFGMNMCVGCGRCDEVCPEIISFSNAVNKLTKVVKELEHE